MTSFDNVPYRRNDFLLPADNWWYPFSFTGQFLFFFLITFFVGTKSVSLTDTERKEETGKCELSVWSDHRKTINDTQKICSEEK